MSRGVIAICTCILLAVFGVVVLAGAVGTAGATEQATNASLGADISSFMQASSAEATDEVDDETFGAAINRTDDPDERRELIEQRQERLQERQQRLQTQREGLGSDPDVRNRSVAARIAVGASGLERSVNETERFAGEAGVDTDQLSEIRSNAREFRGPEVAELARDFTGPPGDSAPEPSENSSSANRAIIVNPSADIRGNRAGIVDSPAENRPDDVGPSNGDRSGATDRPDVNRSEDAGPPTDDRSASPGSDDSNGADAGGSNGTDAVTRGESQREGDRSYLPGGSAIPGHAGGDNASSDDRTR